jgi:hypothetical protein
VCFAQRILTVLQVVKFLSPEMEEPLEVTTVDRGILELKTAIAILRAQTESIQQRIDKCVSLAFMSSQFADRSSAAP